jgi:hypothetical protein xoryp_17970
MGGCRQHGVFGGEPAFTGVFFEAGDALLGAGGAHDSGIAVFDEYGSCGVGGESAGDADGSELVWGTAVGASE